MPQRKATLQSAKTQIDFKQFKLTTNEKEGI